MLGTWSDQSTGSASKSSSAGVHTSTVALPRLCSMVWWSTNAPDSQATSPRAYRGRAAGNQARTQSEFASLQRGDRTRAGPQYHERPHRQPPELHGPQLHSGCGLRFLPDCCRSWHARPPQREMRSRSCRRGARLHACSYSYDLLPTQCPLAPGSDTALR